MNSRSFLSLSLALGALTAAELPTEWVDADTGHRVIRLSREDGTQSLYFNQNAYTADGKKLIVTTAGGGIATITLATREVKPLVAGPVSVLVAGHKSGDVYYTKRPGGGPAPPRADGTQRRPSCTRRTSIPAQPAKSSSCRRDGAYRRSMPTRRCYWALMWTARIRPRRPRTGCPASTRASSVNCQVGLADSSAISPCATTPASRRLPPGSNLAGW